MTLGEAATPGDDETHFNGPSHVLVAPNGEIWVADGHRGGNNRLVKFSQDGRFIMQIGGGVDAATAERGLFNDPHHLAMDSRGRLFVSDRGNNRIQIFDQDGNFLDEWYQFSRLSGIYIDENDILYGVDSESNEARGREDWRRGVRVGSARTGEVWAFLPDPTDPRYMTSSGGEGVVADVDGVIYTAEVGNRSVKRYDRYIDP